MKYFLVFSIVLFASASASAQGATVLDASDLNVDPQGLIRAVPRTNLKNILPSKKAMMSKPEYLSAPSVLPYQFNSKITLETYDLEGSFKNITDLYGNKKSKSLVESLSDSYDQGMNINE